MSDVIHISTQAFEKVKAQPKPVLIDFWAPGCGPCRAQGPILDQVSSQLGDRAVIGKVNVDEEPALAAQFGVSSIPTLVVMQDGKMCGMLTFREVLQALHRHDRVPEEIKVGEVMVANPVTAYPAMEANDLRRLMIEKHSRYLPVMEGDTLQGVISFLDVAKAVLEEQSFENRMLKSYIKNWPGEGEAPAN